MQLLSKRCWTYQPDTNPSDDDLQVHVSREIAVDALGKSLIEAIAGSDGSKTNQSGTKDKTNLRKMSKHVSTLLVMYSSTVLDHC